MINEDTLYQDDSQSLQDINKNLLEEIERLRADRAAKILEAQALKSENNYFRERYGTPHESVQYRHQIETFIQQRADPSVCPHPSTDDGVRGDTIRTFDSIFRNELAHALQTAKLKIEGKLNDPGWLKNAANRLDRGARPLAFLGEAPLIGRALQAISGVLGLVKEAADLADDIKILGYNVDKFLETNFDELARRVCNPLSDFYYHQIIRLNHSEYDNGAQTFARFFVEKAKSYFEQDDITTWFLELFGNDERGLSLERQLINKIMAFGGPKEYLATRDPKINQLNNHTPLKSPWNTQQLERGVGYYDYKNGQAYSDSQDHLYKKYGFRPMSENEHQNRHGSYLLSMGEEPLALPAPPTNRLLRIE